MNTGCSGDYGICHQVVTKLLDHILLQGADYIEVTDWSTTHFQLLLCIWNISKLVIFLQQHLHYSEAASLCLQEYCVYVQIFRGKHINISRSVRPCVCKNDNCNIDTEMLVHLAQCL